MAASKAMNSTTANAELALLGRGEPWHPVEHRLSDSFPRSFACSNSSSFCTIVLLSQVRVFRPDTRYTECRALVRSRLVAAVPASVQRGKELQGGLDDLSLLLLPADGRRIVA
jgi:hypothetical protein